MGKGNNTTTTQTSSSADPQAAAAYRDILNRAQGVASTPYQAYTGELTAPVNAQQTAGISGINANANYASPFIQQAAGMATGAANPLTAGQIQQYQNPYTQNVVDATQRQFDQTNAQQQAALKGNTISSGALGGNREGVAQANLSTQQAAQQNPIIAGLYDKSYSQGLATANQQFQQNPLAASGAIANYGISGQGAALSGAGAQLGAGTLQQQTEQQRLNALYGQYAQAQAYPYQQAQWLAGIGTGVGSQLGGTSSGSTTAPAPNQFAQIAGAGLTAASMFLNRGGAVHGYANGGGVVPQHMADGGVSGTPWSNGVGWIPTMQIHGGSGAPHASAPSAPSQGQAFDPMKFAQGIAGISGGSGGNRVGQFFNPEAYGNTFGGGQGVYGGSSSSPLPGLSAADYGEGFASGGGVAGFAGGGAPEMGVLPENEWNDVDAQMGRDMLRRGVGTVVPQSIPGGEGVINPNEPVRMPDQASVDAWRAGTPLPSQGIAPVAAKSDDDDELPAAATPTQGGAQGVAGPSYKAPYPITPEDYAPTPREQGSSFGLGVLSPNAKSGLLAAGLGMLASRSPNLGNAIGEGGLAGLSAYGSAEERDRKVADEARKLSLEAKKAANSEAHTTFTTNELVRHNKATENREFKPQLIHHPNPATGQEEYGTYDPNTKTIKPLAFPSTGDAKASEKYVSEAAPVEARRKALPASPDARDEGYLKWLDDHRPPGYADVVRGVADYEMDPNRVESLQKGQRSQLYRDAKLYDPTYDQTHFKEKGDVIASFSRGADRAAVNSLNVGISHLGTLKDLGSKLENGNWPLVNNIFNRIGAASGKPEVTNFNAAKEIVGDEVVKAIVGGVNSQADREAIKHLIMAQQSPAQLQGTINTFVALMAGQLEGRRTGYQAGTGLNNFDQKYLSPEARDAMVRHGGSGQVDPAIAKAVYPSGVPVRASSAPPAAGGFTPPQGALPGKPDKNGKVWYYDPQTKQPLPGQ